MRCETFLFPVQSFLCGGPSIEPCGTPLLVAEVILAKNPRVHEGSDLYYRFWGDSNAPAMRESELVSTLAGWLAFEERVWQTALLWEAGKSEAELGCSICRRSSSEDHKNCNEEYRRMREEYHRQSKEEREEEPKSERGR
jgi:hypothetical protein